MCFAKLFGQKQTHTDMVIGQPWLASIIHSSWWNIFLGNMSFYFEYIKFLRFRTVQNYTVCIYNLIPSHKFLNKLASYSSVVIFLWSVRFYIALQHTESLYINICDYKIRTTISKRLWILVCHRYILRL